MVNSIEVNYLEVLGSFLTGAIVTPMLTTTRASCSSSFWCDGMLGVGTLLVAKGMLNYYLDSYKRRPRAIEIKDMDLNRLRCSLGNQQQPNPQADPNDFVSEFFPDIQYSQQPRRRVTRSRSPQKFS